MREILDKYIIGKDENKPYILEGIYTEDAVVEFTVIPDTISFPPEIVGNKEIARVLSADFNERYDNVKTYYLDPPTLNREDMAIHHQGWMVVMREKSSGILKLGSGHYSWFFTQTDEDWRISRHEITIGVMHDQPDYPVGIHEETTALLTYPWSSREEVLEAINRVPVLNPLGEYLKGRA